jgi:hypothetical protein
VISRGTILPLPYHPHQILCPPFNLFIVIPSFLLHYKLIVTKNLVLFKVFIMFRQSLQRCAGRVATALVVPRVAPVLRASFAASVRRPVVSSRISILASRAYSTESNSAAAADSAASTHGEPEIDTRFESLADVGVHPNLLRAILGDMGYENMTPVQAKTIRPALQGSDMLVAPFHRDLTIDTAS